MELQFFMIKGA